MNSVVLGKILFCVVIFFALQACERPHDASTAIRNEGLSNYAYQYQKPGADIRLVDSFVTLSDAGTVQTVAITLWVGRAAGEMAVNIASTESVEIIAQAFKATGQEVEMGQAFPLEFTMYAKQVGRHNLPINVSIAQRDGRVLRRALTLVVQVSSPRQRSSALSSRQGGANLLRSAEGKLLKVYPAEENIR